MPDYENFSIAEKVYGFRKYKYLSNCNTTKTYKCINTIKAILIVLGIKG